MELQKPDMNDLQETDGEMAPRKPDKNNLCTSLDQSFIPPFSLRKIDVSVTIWCQPTMTSVASDITLR